MFSYGDISRWLTAPLDPITVEDWLANRDHFGPVPDSQANDKELEMAYQIESLRQGRPASKENLPLETLLSGTPVGANQKLSDDIWVVAPMGSVNLHDKVAVELEIAGGGRKDKVFVPPVEIKSIPLDSAQNYKIKAKLRGDLRIDKKSEVVLEITGCKKLVIDSRGRPVIFLDLNAHRERLVRWKSEL